MPIGFRAFLEFERPDPALIKSYIVLHIFVGFSLDRKKFLWTGSKEYPTNI